MHTADDDSVPVPQDALKLPRALLNWKPPPPRVWRPQRDDLDPDDTAVSRFDTRYASGTSSAARDDDPTRAIQIPILSQPPERADVMQVVLARGAVYLDAARARAAKLWRDSPRRVATALAGAALITALALAGVPRGNSVPRGNDDRPHTVLAPAAALPAAAVPIIVEQLHEVRQPLQAVAAPPHGEQSDKQGRSSVSTRAHATSVATPAHAKPKASGVEHSSPTVSRSSAGLPAWGADALRDFSSGKSSPGASATTHAQAPTVKPASSNADIPPPMAGYRPSTREQTKVAPVVAAKPAEPPKPEAPPPPSKPLTMDQVLNQVEDIAQAQRKQAGLKAPKTSKHDAELEELINGAMKSKTK